MEEKSKINPKIIIISAIMALFVALGTFAFYFFYNGTANEQSAETLINENSNPETSEFGILLINKGALNPSDAEEFNEPQYNFFEGENLSSASKELPVFEMINNKTAYETYLAVASSLNLNILNVTEISETESYISRPLYNSKGEEFFLSVSKQDYVSTLWQYVESNLYSLNHKCPNLAEPSIYDFNRKTPDEILNETSEGQSPNYFPEYEGLTETQLNEIFFLDAYNLAVEEYEKNCSSEANAFNNQNGEQEVKTFLQNFNFNSDTLMISFTKADDYGLTTAEVFQKINNIYGPKVAEIQLNSAGAIVSGNGYYYDINERATVTTLSPEESLSRTFQQGRILAEINPEYSKKYELITTISPKTEQTEYILNNHDEIYGTISTRDGILIVPAYILYNSSNKSGIYTVAVPDRYFEAIP